MSKSRSEKRDDLLYLSETLRHYPGIDFGTFLVLRLSKTGRLVILSALETSTISYMFVLTTQL